MHLKKYSIVLAFLIFFATFLYVLSSSKLFDSDFWWHITTGRQIVVTGTIPDDDPFTYTEHLSENRNLLPVRKDFILKQYWLAQVIFYLIFDSLGPAGILLLRGLILTSVLFLITWRLKQWDVSFYIIFISVFLVYLDIIRCTGERPVLFTILFSPLTFYLLEEFKQRATRDTPKSSGEILFLLIPLMLLWANLHGGFIIGNIIIAVYIAAESIKILTRKITFGKRGTIIFYTATVTALLVSLINPTGWNAFSIALSPAYKFLELGVQEYQSPFVLYFKKLTSINYGFVAMAALYLVILIVRNRKLDLSHFILLTGLLIMGYKGARYTIYYTSIAAMILGRETDIIIQHLLRKKLSDEMMKRLVAVFSVVTLLSSIFFFIGVVKFKWIKLDIARGSYVPVSAVNFIEGNRLPGNIMNSHPYGGYLAWRLYPWKRTFIDTRWLNYAVQSEYAWIMGAVDSIQTQEIEEGKTPLWKRLLDHYDINVVMLDTLDVYGTVPRLTFALAQDDEWVPVYTEPIAVIFIRDVPKNSDIIETFRLTKENVFNTVVSIAAQMAIVNKDNPKFLITLGKTFHEMDRLEDALTSYEYAFRRLPDEPGLREEIEKIKKELEGTKKDEGD